MKQLGAGGFGVVWRAHQPALGRDVALKVLRAEGGPEQLARFDREARLTAGLKHAGIVQILDHGGDGNERWIAYELLEGESLAERLERGPLSWEDARVAGVQIAAALEEAHAHGVLHRDVKPGNVMATPGPVYKLLDFGIARLSAAESGLTAPGTVMGTPAYVAPWLLCGEPASAAADVYALGATLFELVTGRPPFEGAQVGELLARKVAEDAPRCRMRRPEVPPAFDAAIARALARDAADGYPDARAFRLDLEAIRADAARSPTVRSRPAAHRTLPMRPPRAALAAALVVGAVLAAALALRLRPEPERVSAAPVAVASEPATSPEVEGRLQDGLRRLLVLCQQFDRDAGNEGSAWKLALSGNAPARLVEVVNALDGYFEQGDALGRRGVEWLALAPVREEIMIPVRLVEERTSNDPRVKDARARLGRILARASGERLREVMGHWLLHAMQLDPVRHGSRRAHAARELAALATRLGAGVTAPPEEAAARYLLLHDSVGLWDSVTHPAGAQIAPDDEVRAGAVEGARGVRTIVESVEVDAAAIKGLAPGHANWLAAYAARWRALAAAITSPNATQDMRLRGCLMAVRELQAGAGPADCREHAILHDAADGSCGL